LPQDEDKHEAPAAAATTAPCPYSPNASPQIPTDERRQPLSHPKKGDDALNELVDTILSSSRYKEVAPSLIRAIAKQELAKRRNLKEAVKATKNKLHQVSGAYLDSTENYAAWLLELQEASSVAEPDYLRERCRQIMRHHASTRERLPILSQFYAEIFAHLPPVHSLLDVACGLNPLAIPWMPLAKEATYLACDIQRDMMAFLQGWFDLSNRQGYAQVCDVLSTPPTHKVDVALLLKTISCLEQVDKTAGIRLLQAIQADYLVISYPARSLGGKNKGMVDYYKNHFHELVAHESWKITMLTFPSELVFVVEK